MKYGRRLPAGWVCLGLAVVLCCAAHAQPADEHQPSVAWRLARTNWPPNALRSTLAQIHTVRSQLELYRVQHAEQYPDLLKFWDQMTKETKRSGLVLFGAAYGPYLQKAPRSLFTFSSRVVHPAQANMEAGWTFDPKTRVFKAIVPRYVFLKFGLSPRDYHPAD